MKKFYIKNKYGDKLILESTSPEVTINELFNLELSEQEYFLTFHDEEKNIYRVLLDNEKLTIALIFKIFRYARGFSMAEMDKSLTLTKNGFRKVLNRKDLKFTTILKICLVLDIKLRVLEPFKKDVAELINIDL